MSNFAPKYYAVMKRIEVVAAIIHDEGGRIFATQRGYGDMKDGWEFPGGKMEAGETPADALKREIREELETEIVVERLVTTVDYDYPAFHLTMHCFWCQVESGSLTLKEHEAARWLTMEQLDSVDWLPADLQVVEAIKNSYLNTENIARSKDGVEYHPLRPCLPENARVLFLGSFPPQRKRWCMDFYYPNFINDHWRIEGQLFFGDKNHFVDAQGKRFKLDEIVAFCQEKGLAFFDTSTAIRRLKDNASDKFLEVVEPTDIRTLMAQLPHLRAIVTTGEKATETICTTLNIPEVPKVGTSVEIPKTCNADGDAVLLYRLPSSSRAYPLSFDKKAEAYGEMFSRVGLSSSRP